MAGNQGLAFPLQCNRVAAMLRQDEQSCLWRKVLQGHTPFNFGLHDMAIHHIAQVRVRPEL
jgi:hypothetical protein